MPEPTPNEEIGTLAEEIRGYLETHPDAADSLEGVVTWWLMRQRYREATDKVEQALEHLIREGVVVEVRTSGGRSIYSSAVRRLPGEDTD